MKMFAYLTAGLLLSVLSSTAYAHGFWVAPRLDKPTIIYGDGAIDSRYKTERIGQVIGLDAAYQPVVVGVQKGEHNAWLDMPKDTNIVTVQFTESYYTEDAQGKRHRLPKKDVPNAKKTTKNVLSTIALLDSQSSPATLSHLPLQIITLADPFSLKKGDSLPVQVRFNGNPIADVPVIADYLNDPDNTQKTDNNGMATVVVGSNTLNVLYAYHKTAGDGVDVDNITYVNTLSFNLQKHH